MTKPIKAIYGAPDRPLIIGDIEIPCYVLEDERRVIVQRGMQKGIGMSTGGGTGGAQRLVHFVQQLEAKGLNCKDLVVRMKEPIIFIPPKR